MEDSEQFKGANFLRQRLVLATLSGKLVKITQIRTVSDKAVGLQDFEASFLRLLHAVTDGSEIEINETGTSLTYKPGKLVGGTVSHVCPPSRAVTYWLEPLLLLGPFMEEPLHVTLQGVTNHPDDITVDTFRTVTLATLKPFGLEGLALKVLKRGALPLGGGKVVFDCPITPLLQPITWLEPDRVKRIRGVAFTSKVSTQFGARMVDPARGVLNMCCPDVWIYADHFKGEQAGKSPGFGLSLFAETIKGSIYSADICTHEGALEKPEELGKLTAARLLEEVDLGGVVDTSHQFIPLLMMSLADEIKPSKVLLGRLTPYTTQLLRDVKHFLGVKFRFEQSPDGVLCSCVGIGRRNLARRTF
jgi:RNA 3'-terminal phosphate cyclase-like protein